MTQSAASSRSPVPASIGPYRILGVLGQGGMGVVYRAEDSAGNRVALKTVRVGGQGQLRGIRGEILALTKLQHPNVVRILGQGQEGGLPWYAMELLEGETLAARAVKLWKAEGVSSDEATGTMASGSGAAAGSAPPSEVSTVMPNSQPSAGSGGSGALEGGLYREAEARGGPKPPAAGGHLPEVLRLFRGLCEPLAFMHGMGIVHRDLKPTNVFIRKDGAPVLMDFGVVSRFRGASGREVVEVAGAVVGSASYMSPEQIRGERVDARADLYALGCMLYELVTGRRPFVADTVAKVLEKHLTDAPLPPSERAEGVPKGLDALILRLMAKKPRERLGYADDVAAALVELGAEQPRQSEESAARAYLYRPEIAGRREVLESIAEHLEEARGGQGGVVLLGGESGVGKTFLVSEVSRSAAQRRLHVVTGECLPISVAPGIEGGKGGGAAEVKGAPLHPFRQLLQNIADACRERGLGFTEAVLGRRGKVLAAYESSLAGLPGQDAYPEPPEVSAEAAQRRVLDDLAGTLAAFVSREGPLLLVLDDLQWADELSLGFLATSLTDEYLNELGLLVLGTYRSDEVGAGLKEVLAKPGVRRIELGRLDEKAVGSVVGDMLALASPPEAMVRFLSRQSEGNPFFVAEYLRAAVAERLLYREAGAWRFTAREMTEAQFEALPLPGSVRELVGRRLDALAPRARHLVEVASVLGREVDGALLRAAAEASEDESLELLKELTARQILEPLGAERYRFVHDKLREHAYQGIAPERRRALHQAAAVTLEQAQQVGGNQAQPYGTLAHHFQKAEAWPKALDYLEKAGEQALRDFSNQEAAAFFNQALELNARLSLGASPVRLAAWERSLVEAHLALGRGDEGRAHAERALQHCGRPWPTSKAGWAMGLLGQILSRVLQPKNGWRKVDEPARRALTHEAAYVYNRMLEPSLAANRPLEGLYCGMRGLNLADRIAPSAALARGYAFMSHLVGVTPMRGVAHAWALRGLDYAEKLGHAPTTIYCLSRTSCLSISLGSWAEMEQRMKRAVELSESTGDARQIEESYAVLATGLNAQGRFEESLKAGRKALALAVKRGDPQTEAWTRPVMGLNLARQGREDEALSVLTANQKWLDEKGGDAEVMWAHGARALAYLGAGEPAKAKECADKLLVLVRKQPPMNYFLGTAFAGAAEAYLGLWEAKSGGDGLPAAANEICTVLEKYAKLFPYAQPIADLRRGRQLWLAGNQAKATAKWRAGLALAEKLDMPFEQGLAHYEQGRHLKGPERMDHLSQAVALFEKVSAKRDVERTKKALTETP